MYAGSPKHPIFSGSTFGLMSGEKPLFKPQVEGGHEALGGALQQMGLKYEETSGKYKEPERSYIIHSPTVEQMRQLGKMFGQESVIHSQNGQHRLVYTNGEHEGKFHAAHHQNPVEHFEQPPPDFYTTVPGHGYMRINFDWDKMHPVDASMAKAERTFTPAEAAQWMKVETAKLMKAQPPQIPYETQVAMDGLQDQGHQLAEVPQSAGVQSSVKVQKLPKRIATNMARAVHENEHHPSAPFDPKAPLDDRGRMNMKKAEWSNSGVNAEIEPGQGRVAIHSWSSQAPGQGNTVRALQQLRAEFPKVHVVGIGSSPQDPSWVYWTRMHQRGLIDSMEDDEGRAVTPMGKVEEPGAIPSADAMKAAWKMSPAHPHAYDWHDGHTVHHEQDLAGAQVPGLIKAEGASLKKSLEALMKSGQWSAAFKHRKTGQVVVTAGGSHHNVGELPGWPDEAFDDEGHPAWKEWTPGFTNPKGVFHSRAQAHKAAGIRWHTDLDKAEPVAPPQPAAPTNDQAAGVGASTYKQFALPYGKVEQGTSPNLLHYPYHGKLPEIEKLSQDHGFKTYYAGGKYGKPDLANKNYNTGHLMVYDPTPASGGDFGHEEYTKGWRQIHELAHALTYPELNKIYGEGRRIGKLGTHRTLNEALRSVHWEWLAAHKQRELSKQIGVNVKDEDFHKELNTVMHDAAHRAVTGKFTEPSGEGFTPHGHKVPLHTALQLVRDAGHQMGLTGLHDLVQKKSEAPLNKALPPHPNSLVTADALQEQGFKPTKGYATPKGGLGTRLNAVPFDDRKGQRVDAEGSLPPRGGSYKIGGTRYHNPPLGQSGYIQDLAINGAPATAEAIQAARFANLDQNGGHDSVSEPSDLAGMQWADPAIRATGQTNMDKPQDEAYWNEIKRKSQPGTSPLWSKPQPQTPLGVPTPDRNYAKTSTTLSELRFQAQQAEARARREPTAKSETSIAKSLPLQSPAAAGATRTTQPQLHNTVEGFMTGLKALPKGDPSRGKFITSHMNHGPFLSALHTHPQGKQIHAMLNTHLNSKANAGPGQAVVTVKSEHEGHEGPSCDVCGASGEDLDVHTCSRCGQFACDDCNRIPSKGDATKQVCKDCAPKLVEARAKLAKAWPKDEKANQANAAGFLGNPVARDQAMEQTGVSVHSPVVHTSASPAIQLPNIAQGMAVMPHFMTGRTAAKGHVDGKIPPNTDRGLAALRRRASSYKYGIQGHQSPHEVEEAVAPQGARDPGDDDPDYDINPAAEVASSPAGTASSGIYWNDVATEEMNDRLKQTKKSEAPTIFAEGEHPVSEKTYSIEEARSILMKATKDRVESFEKGIKNLRDRELKKALIQPHKHNEGMQASAGNEDVPPGRANPKGVDKSMEKTIGEPGAGGSSMSTGLPSGGTAMAMAEPDDDRSDKPQVHQNHTCTDCGKQNTTVTEAPQGKGPAGWHCSACLSKSMNKSEELCKKCSKSHPMDKACGMAKADLVAENGKRTDNHTVKGSKLPDDAKSKVVKTPGSGGKISLPGSNLKKNIPGGPQIMSNMLTPGVNKPVKSTPAKWTIKKNAAPPMAKPPSGKNMGTAVPTSAPKAPTMKPPAAPTMKSDELEKQVDKMVVHGSAPVKPPKDADYSSKKDGDKAVYESKKPAELEKGILSPGVKQQMSTHMLADASKQATAGTAPAAAPVKLPTPAQHAERAAGFQAAMPGPSFQPTPKPALASPKAAGVTRSVLPVQNAARPQRPGIFGKLFGKSDEMEKAAGKPSAREPKTPAAPEPKTPWLNTASDDKKRSNFDRKPRNGSRYKPSHNDPDEGVDGWPPKK